MPSPSNSIGLLVLAAHAVRASEAGPRRFLEVNAFPSRIQAKRAVAEWFANDQELETQYFAKPRGAARLWASRLLFLWRNRREIRSARFIYCWDNICFSWLLALAKVGFFDPKGKTIRRVAFRNGMLGKLGNWLRKSDPAFQVEFITREQASQAASELGENRVCLRPWKIDADWYQVNPSHEEAEAWFLCPGNIQRDETLILKLLETGRVRIIRAGRSEKLREVYAEWLEHPNFQLHINSSHASYRLLLASAAAVLLPICPCDEPAGLTAALETVACQVPLLANESMGIKELLEQLDYPLPLVTTNDLASWLQAMEQVPVWRRSKDSRERLQAARDRLVQTRAILPEGRDWLEVAAPATEA